MSDQSETTELPVCHACGWVIDYGCGCDPHVNTLAAIAAVGSLPLLSDAAIIVLAQGSVDR